MAQRPRVSNARLGSSKPFPTYGISIRSEHLARHVSRHLVEKPGLGRQTRQCVDAKGPAARPYWSATVFIVEGTSGARVLAPSWGRESA